LIGIWIGTGDKPWDSIKCGDFLDCLRNS
jgi:hypothetical protein